jgi:hypothetical protein
MKYTGMPLLASLALGIAVASAAGIGEGSAATRPVPVSGVYLFTFYVSDGIPLPQGARLTCKARVVPKLPAGESLQAQPAMMNAAARATMTGAATTCAMEIPFSWVVNKAQKGAALSYAIEAETGSEVVVRTIWQEGIDVDYPPQGGVLRVNLNVSF